MSVPFNVINIEETIKKKHAKLSQWFLIRTDMVNPFIFVDFEVFAKDWMLCFSLDGIHIKTIVNDPEKLANIFLHKFKSRCIVAYNGNGYDKWIMMAILNGLDPKEVSDRIISEFNFNFYRDYGDGCSEGYDLTWYDPMTRNAGSLKTYEACEGENIYESEVDFNLDRQLSEAEIIETSKYCSFDVQQLIKYFYCENFDSFLGHVGLIESMMEVKDISFNKAMGKTDASLVGTYLCTEMGIDLTRSTDIIELPDNIHLGKYEAAVKEFLKTPIKILKSGRYNGLNKWSLNQINKAIARGKDETVVEKLKAKEAKKLAKIKKSKMDLQLLQSKSKITKKQAEKLNDLPNIINKTIEELHQVRNDIILEQAKTDELQRLINLLNVVGFDSADAKSNKITKQILEVADLSDHANMQLLKSYLSLDQDQLFDFQYATDKKTSRYNKISIQYEFCLKLDIKGIMHLFKTGGIHSIASTAMEFDKRKTPNKTLIIADVNSLYPSLMVVFGLCSIGMDNPAQFAQMIKDRVILKEKKDPFANVLKLILNTAYGCMGSAFNNLYDPSNRLRVCIFGQACIVDLLDKLEDQLPSLEIYQSNTDGIIVAVDNNELDGFHSIVDEWEARTGLGMTRDVCTYLKQKDVSNYILITE